MSRIPQQLTMGVIIGNRGFFPSYLVAEAREQAVALFSRLGINTIMLDPSQTDPPRQNSRCRGAVTQLW